MIIKFDRVQLPERLEGTTVGTVFPRPFMDVDARHVALEALKTYLTLLIFTRRGGVNEKPIEYVLPRENIQTEMPGDDGNKDVSFPAVAVVAGEGVHDNYGLGAGELLDDTVDVYGQGTVLYRLAEYQEEFNLEVWGRDKPERRSLVAGMLEAFSPLQETSSLRLKLPEYYDRVARFTLTGEKYIDDPDVARNRFRAQLRVELTVPEVCLVGYVRFRPYVEVQVTDGQVQAQAELVSQVLSAMTGS